MHGELADIIQHMVSIRSRNPNSRWEKARGRCQSIVEGFRRPGKPGCGTHMLDSIHPHSGRSEFMPGRSCLCRQIIPTAIKNERWYVPSQAPGAGVRLLISCSLSDAGRSRPLLFSCSLRPLGGGTGGPQQRQSRVASSGGRKAQETEPQDPNGLHGLWCRMRYASRNASEGIP